jgi:hypothetical protein
MHWYTVAAGALLLLASFVAGMLFEKKNEAKIEAALTQAKQAVADVKKL